MAVEELSHGLEVAKFVFALSIQGLNGNIEPFLEHSNSVRPFPFVNKVAEDIRNILHDRYLWGTLSDPSFHIGTFILLTMEEPT